jgi:hypothetical protein
MQEDFLDDDYYGTITEINKKCKSFYDQDDYKFYKIWFTNYESMRKCINNFKARQENTWYDG